MKMLTKAFKDEVNRLALKHRIPAAWIRMVCLNRNITPKKAVKVIEREMTREREKTFEF